MKKIIPLLLVMMLVGCARYEDLERMYGGKQSIETVNNATSVKAFRLKSPNSYSATLADYTMTTGPVVVSEASAAKIRKILLNPRNYGWDVKKSCGEPDYGVRFQFHTEKDDIDVLLCFRCDILGVYHNGTAVGGVDFEDARPQLVAIIKEIFPDDSVIQSLEDKH